MPDMRHRCGLYSALWQWCVGATLYRLPAGLEPFAPVQGRLPFLVAVAVIELAGPGISSCLRCGLDFLQWLCLCGVVVEIVVVHYR